MRPIQFVKAFPKAVVRHRRGLLRLYVAAMAMMVLAVFNKEGGVNLLDYSDRFKELALGMACLIAVSTLAILFVYRLCVVSLLPPPRYGAVRRATLVFAGSLTLIWFGLFVEDVYSWRPYLGDDLFNHPIMWECGTQIRFTCWNSDVEYLVRWFVPLLACWSALLLFGWVVRGFLYRVSIST